MYTKKIRSIAAFVCLLTCMTTTAAMAQMQAAVKIIPDYTHETFIKNSPVKIWRVIRDLPKVKDYSNGTITAVTINPGQDDKPPTRELTFSDGRKRIDEIEQVHESYKFFVFNVRDPRPQGVNRATVTALVESLPDKDDTSVVRWSIYLEGDKKLKKPLVDELTKEIGQYELGLKKLLDQ